MPEQSTTETESARDRHVVVVDVESTGLDPRRHTCVEVAWWNLNTGERGAFIPPHDVHEALAGADIKALQITRYIDRIADQQQDTQGIEAAHLWGALHGNTLAGSNPAFDAVFLTAMLRGAPLWHHRLWDLSAYAAGVLSLRELPGLSTVCTMLNIEVEPDHSAETDVTATGLCFLELFKRAGVVLDGD